MDAVDATIIVPVLNRYDLLDRLVPTIGRARNLIIIDNGDGLTDEVISFWMYDGHLNGVDRAYLYRMPTNLGVAASWNLGIKMTPHSGAWLLVNSDAWFEPGAYDQFIAEAAPDRLLLGGTPPWCCVAIGSEVIRSVGLFCERFYPAYMEDVDYERRARIIGVDVQRSTARIGHDNSSTIAADPKIAAKNRTTHSANALFYEYRWANADANGLPPVHEWNLETRLRNDWG